MNQNPDPIRSDPIRDTDLPNHSEYWQVFAKGYSAPSQKPRKRLSKTPARSVVVQVVIENYASEADARASGQHYKDQSYQIVQISHVRVLDVITL